MLIERETGAELPEMVMEVVEVVDTGNPAF